MKITVQEEGRMNRSVAGVMFALVCAGAVPADAKPTWVKKVQAAGFPEIKDCLACHTKKSGKVPNARGQFLIDRKKETGAKEVDFQWLKEYKDPAAPEPIPPSPEEPEDAKKEPEAKP
jgi:hypothetical protein